MNKNTSFAKIGATVIAGVAAIIFTFIYIGGIRNEGPSMMMETYYEKGVKGLTVGSDVTLRGVKIGRVDEIAFIGTKYNVNDYDAVKIYVRLKINFKKMGITSEVIAERKALRREYFAGCVKNGLRALVSANGITGISQIELDYYPPEKASKIEEISWEPKDIFVPPQISLLDSLSDSATKVMNQINKMDMNSFTSNIVASADAIAKATETIKTMLEAHQADAEKICDDLASAVSSIKEAAEEVKNNPSLLIRDRELRSLPETER